MDKENSSMCRNPRNIPSYKHCWKGILGIVNIGKYGTVFAGLLLTSRQLQPGFDQEVTGSWDWRLDTSVPLTYRIFNTFHTRPFQIFLPHSVQSIPWNFQWFRWVSGAQNTPKGECGPSAAGRDVEMWASRTTGRIASLFWSAAPHSRPGFNEGLFFVSCYAK